MKVKAHITFEFDTKYMDEQLLNDFSKEPHVMEDELKAYALDCTVDDIYLMVKYGELSQAINVEVVSDEE